MARASTAATDAPELAPAGFYAGLLDRFAEIVGEGAGYATFHFAAVQEGLEHVRGLPDDPDPEEALRSAARALGAEVEVSRSESALVVKIVSCSLLERDSRILEGVLAGFFEGAARAATGAVHEATVERGTAGTGTLRLGRKGGA